MRRIVLFLASLIAVFGMLSTTAGIASAAPASVASVSTTSAMPSATSVAPVISQTLPNGDYKLLYNVIETYGWCYDTATSKPYWGTCTNGFDSTGWHYNCYQVDCGQLVVGPTGVSADKRTDFRFLGGYDYYQYDDLSTAFSFNIGTGWTDVNHVVPYFQSGSFAGTPYKLQLLSVTTYYYRDGFPLQTIAACPANDICKGGGGMK